MRNDGIHYIDETIAYVDKIIDLTEVIDTTKRVKNKNNYLSIVFIVIACFILSINSLIVQMYTNIYIYIYILLYKILYVSLVCPNHSDAYCPAKLVITFILYQSPRWNDLTRRANDA